MAPPADLARTIRIEQDGSVQRLLPRVVPVPSLTPETAGAVLLLYDVTDLVRLDEMRSELIGVASHELQTPLTTLRMALLMLQEASDALPQRQRELVATSLIGVEQLAETVHEFLDLTRIEAGELRLNLEPVQVGATIAESIRRVETQASAQGITLVASVASDLPPILADPVRLRAVFDNILSNALKYTPEIRHDHDRDTAGTNPWRRWRRTGVNRSHRHWSWHSSHVPHQDLRKILPPRTSSDGGDAGRAWRWHRLVYVPADRRVAWRRDLVRRRCRRVRHADHRIVSGAANEARHR